MRRARQVDRVSTLALIVGVLLTAQWSSAGSSVAAQGDDAPVDMSAVTLTTSDLEDAGLDGYGVESASPFNLAQAAAYLSYTEDLRPRTVEWELEDAGFVACYSTAAVLRDEGDDPAEPPQGQIETSAFLFEDEDGAAEAFDLISGGGAGDNVVPRLGDDSAMSVITYPSDERYGVPSVEYQLEFVSGQMVLGVSTLMFGDAAEERSDAADDAVTDLLSDMASSMEDRAERALDGDAPGLGALVVQVESDLDLASYRSYDLLDGEAIRIANESDDGFEARVAGQLDRGTVSFLTNDQPLSEGTESLSEYRLTNAILRFEDESAAETYLDDVVDRLRAGAPPDASVEVLDEELGLGDETLAIVIEREDANGDLYEATQLFVRVEETIGLLLVTQLGPVTAPIEVTLDGLIPLGEAQVTCFEEGACEGPIEVPDEIAEMVDTALEDAA